MTTLNMSALRKGNAKDLMDKLKKGISDSANKGGSKEKDTRFWSPTVDSAGNGSAIIRFLPAKTEDDFPFVKVHKHAFQENGMWMIAECPTTVGNPCPVCEDNRAHWATKDQSRIEIARKHKRDTKYIANVLVIKDPANPENEGQIRLYRYGTKIQEKLVEAMNADEDLGETPVNPFSFFDGGNLVIRTQMVGGFLNFDKCKVVSSDDLYDGDEEKLMAVMEQMYDLTEFTTKFKYKTYDELAARFAQVTGVSSPAAAPAAQKPVAAKYNKEPVEDLPFEPAAKPAHAAASAEDDDDLAFFRNMVK